MAFLQLQGIQKHFGPVHTIKGIDLTIEKGEFIVFVGPSGCGKSTLLRVLNRMYDLYPGQRATGEVMFDGENLLDRLPLLLKILPYFVVFSFFVCYAFNLTTTKWRFISVPDLLNILRAASVMTVALLVLDYIFLAPNVYGTFFLGKTTIVIYWFMEVFFLSGLRLTYRYFRYTRARNKARTMDAAPTLLIGRGHDIEVVLRAIESGAVRKLDPKGILNPGRMD